MKRLCHPGREINEMVSGVRHIYITEIFHVIECDIRSARNALNRLIRIIASEGDGRRHPGCLHQDDAVSVAGLLQHGATAGLS